MRWRYFTECFSFIALFTVTSSSKFFRENSKLFMEFGRSRQNKSFFKSTLCGYHFLFGNYWLSKLFFSIVFMLWLALFANQHTKSIEKHKHIRFIASKQVKIDMPCRNEKFLKLGAFSDTRVSFSH